MIRVYKSDTGQFVLVHYPSQTVIIDESLDSAFEKMDAYVKENHPELVKEIMQPFERTSGSAESGFGKVRFALLLFLVILPFIWLATLHYSMASLITDFRSEPESEVTSTIQELSGQVEKLQEDLSELGRLVNTDKSK